MVGRAWVGLGMAGYLVCGALLFRYLEPSSSGGSISRPSSGQALIRSHTDHCLNQLWIITERLNVLYERNWTRLVTQQLKEFEKNVIQTVRLQSQGSEQGPHFQWSFAASLLYSLTIVTTIGSGNLSPSTMEGKVATMVYALVGVPLMLVSLSQLGSLLADTIQALYNFLTSFACCCSSDDKHSLPEGSEYQLEERGGARTTLVVGVDRGGRPVCRLTSLESHHSDLQHRASSQDSADEEDHLSMSGCRETPSKVPLMWKGGGCRPPTPPASVALHGGSGGRRSGGGNRGPTVPPFLSLSLLLGYLGLGAWLFSWAHSSPYLEGLFFVFSALTTISLLPTPSTATSHPLLPLLVSTYLLFGLVLVATTFSLLQHQLIQRTRKIARSLGVISSHQSHI